MLPGFVADVSKLREEVLEKGMKIRVQRESDLDSPLPSPFYRLKLARRRQRCVCVFCQLGEDTTDKRWRALATRPPNLTQVPYSRKRPDAARPPDPQRKTGQVTQRLVGDALGMQTPSSCKIDPKVAFGFLQLYTPQAPNPRNKTP